jgi:hypothetical protein
MEMDVTVARDCISLRQAAELGMKIWQSVGN